MRIAITADPFIPVPPLNYGGIERVIHFLAEGLAKQGHEVMLVANEQSTASIPMIRYPKDKGGIKGHTANMLAIKSLRNWQPHIIHSFSRLAYLLPFLLSPVPKIMSYQREPTLSQIKKAGLIALKGSLNFTGCSNYITNQIKKVATAHTVYNGVDTSLYNYRDSVKSDAPLIFLGRIEPIKGTHHAVDTALKTGCKLIIAGNIPNEHSAYFTKLIKPHLSNDIEYVGPVNDVQKNELLGQSRAMLMPIEWNEPFGIVMCEAMACGTPVIALNKGAAPEVVKDGQAGFICDTTAEMVKAVNNLHKINRKIVRDFCVENFSSDVIIQNYLALYTSLIKTA